jgi:hypothetical protein
MKYSWYLVLISVFVLIVGTGASPAASDNQLWAQTCNSNNKRGVVVSTNDTLVPLSGNWATTSSCSPTATQTSPTTTSTGTEATWEAPTPTYQPVQCAIQNPSTWSWSDYLYRKRAE